MTLEERAREIADIFLTPPMAIALQNSIAEALRTVRNEALEEAAKVADHEEGLRSGSQTFPCIAIAAVIRSLKESP